MSHSICIGVVALLALVASTLAGPTQPSILGQLPQVGNGFVATLVNTSTEYIAGLFSGATPASMRAAIPASSNIFLKCAFVGKVVADQFPFQLDQAKGIVSLEGRCPNANVQYVQRWYAHQKWQEVMVTEIFVTAGNATLLDIIDLTPSVDDPLIAPTTVEVQRTFDNVTNSTMAVFRTVAEEEIGSGLATVGFARTPVPASIAVLAGSNNSLVLRVLSGRAVSFGAATKPDQLMVNAMDVVRSAMQKSSEELLQEHTDAWADLWAHSIDIDGGYSGPIMASQYAIMSSLREAVPYSTSPGGLPTNGYNGHTFWDMETWVNPNMMIFHPSIALAGFQYRIDRLGTAKGNAKVVHKLPGGAAFPWESAFTGSEVCPMAIYADTELHVTADVALAVQLHFYLTNDLDFLRTAWPLLNETALFWVYRTTALDGGTGAVNLNNATGADEYHLGNNSAFTNGAVMKAVRFTLEAAKRLGIEDSKIPHAQAMRRIAENMTILFNATGNYHPEYEGYNGEPIKQADVILLNYPLGLDQNATTVRNDLDYYANRTIPNKSGASTMTWSMYSIGYFSLGLAAEGVEFFEKGYVNNCFPPYYQWYQQMGGGGNPNFISGAGGFVQNVWAGFGGLRVTGPGEIVVNVQSSFLPPDTTHLTLKKLRLAGAEVTVNYLQQPRQISVVQHKQQQQGPALCVAVDDSQPTALTLESPFTIQLASGAKKMVIGLCDTKGGAKKNHEALIIIVAGIAFVALAVGGLLVVRRKNNMGKPLSTKDILDEDLHEDSGGYRTL